MAPADGATHREREISEKRCKRKRARANTAEQSAGLRKNTGSAVGRSLDAAQFRAAWLVQRAGDGPERQRRLRSRLGNSICLGRNSRAKQSSRGAAGENRGGGVRF